MLERLEFNQFKIVEQPTAEDIAQEWFNAAVKRGEAAPFCEIVRITPELADVMLRRNPKNRPINTRRVDQIASDIRANLWRLNGETVIVSQDGYLNDGQHRLAAIINAGFPVSSFVVFGVDRNARTTTDLGAARTAANLLAMNGAISTTRAAAVAVWLLRYERREISHSGARMPTKTEQTAKYWAHQEEIDDAVRFVERKNASEMSAQTALAVAYILIKRVAGDAADIFFEKLCEGAGYDIGSPIHVTRQKLVEMSQMNKRPGQKIAMIISGWNNWRRGKTKVRTMTFKNEYPEIED